LDHIYEEISNSKFDQFESVFFKNKSIINGLIQVLRALNKNFDYVEELLEQRTDFENILLKSGLEKVFRNVRTGDDGNCFYRCISRIMLGDEQNFFLIKICALFIIFENQSFKDMLYKQKSEFKEVIEKHCKLNEWADETMILATSYAIDRPILIFALTFVDPYCLSYFKDTRFESLTNYLPIPISFSAKHSHYTLLMKHEKNDFNFESFFKNSTKIKISFNSIWSN
jgi:hypothetical protein